MKNPLKKTPEPKKNTRFAVMVGLFVAGLGFFAFAKREESKLFNNN